MDVTLHIGAHRSGTTTLQQFLQRNKSALAEAGLGAWTPDRTRAGMFAGLLQRPQDLTDQIERRAARSCGVIRIEVERLANAGVRRLLISEENLIGAVRNNLREGALYPLLGTRLERLRPALADHVTRIGLCMRAYDTFWASSVAFGVAQGHRVPAPSKLDMLVHQPRRWRHLVAEIAGAFPRAEIVVWPFERLCGQPEVQLSALTGGAIQLPQLAGARDWHNPSPRLDKLRRILTLRGDVAMATRLPKSDGRWTPFDAEQSDRLRRQYHEDLAWFAGGAEGMARLVEGPMTNNNDTIINDLPDRHYEVSGFAAPPPSWAPPEGGQLGGKQNLMV